MNIPFSVAALAFIGAIVVALFVTITIFGAFGYGMDKIQELRKKK